MTDALPNGSSSTSAPGPRPGDGAFLAGPQPGDGQFLAQQANRGEGRGGQSSRGRGGRTPGGGKDGRGRKTPGQAALVDSMSTLGLANQTAGPASNVAQHPRRPRQPRQIVQAPVDGSTTAANPRSRSNRGRKPNGQSTTNGHLDPSAVSFTPSSSTPTTSAPNSRAASPSRNKAPKTNRKEAKPPAAPKSSRRAAFEQQTKLTATHTDESSTIGDKAHGKEKVKKTKEPEKDDLVSRLTRGLKSRPYLECPICFNTINPGQPIWSCLPPTSPPPLVSETPDVPPISASNHYSACYTPFHLSCIRDWANRSLVEEKDRARNAGRDEENVSWRCPGCQKRRQEHVGGYRCFCGRLSSPPTISSAPHSCGDSCQRSKPGCSHACPLQCHPGPCPPCQAALIAPCPSHHTALTVKCSVATSNNAAMTPVCDEVCGRERGCGNPDHACMELCHYGECAPCSALEIVQCYCGEESKEVVCGWNRRDEKQCVKLGEEGGVEHWSGRYSCEKRCEALYDCGIHPCDLKCHPHPLRPLPCPSSPSQVTHCHCGQTLLTDLPVPPRQDCVSPIPTCGQRCPKLRPCGHQCPKSCHAGDCPPCHEEVVRPCRCGESMLVIGCDELREKVLQGEDVVCERICRALRNCGRHECGRVCCPLAYKAKNRKAKRDDDSTRDDLHECHLTCGRLLSCGLHTCQKKDHKGACGKCLQASYEELICHCGHTVIYPPVACGTTINCLYPCARDAPECGHPKAPHPCHESPQCPPCPFLTTKPCACGKDPSVKNVRCSQEKVSCGQPCGLLLSCGYHRCALSCHRPGECEPCHQTCNKAKKICRHPCTIACHAPTKCPENDPCQAIITQSCACGHVQQRTSCGASNTNPQSREATTLKCNSECAVRQRNARLADALGISTNKDGSAKGQGLEEWNAEMKGFAGANLGFVKMVESTFAEFIKGVRQTMVLPYMPPAKRTFVMSLADSYRLARELIDQEPNRSVMIRRRIDTRTPNPLLSSVVNVPPPKPSLGSLGNLRAPKGAWGSGTGPSSATAVADGTIASVLAGGSRGAENGLGSKPPSRTATPVLVAPTPIAPVARGERVLGEGKKQGDGDVDVDDWDVSGDEA